MPSPKSIADGVLIGELMLMMSVCMSSADQKRSEDPAACCIGGAGMLWQSNCCLVSCITKLEATLPWKLPKSESSPSAFPQVTASDPKRSANLHSRYGS